MKPPAAKQPNTSEAEQNQVPKPKATSRKNKEVLQRYGASGAPNKPRAEARRLAKKRATIKIAKRLKTIKTRPRSKLEQLKFAYKQELKAQRVRHMQKAMADYGLETEEVASVSESDEDVEMRASVRAASPPRENAKEKPQAVSIVDRNRATCVHNFVLPEISDPEAVKDALRLMKKESCQIEIFQDDGGDGLRGK